MVDLSEGGMCVFYLLRCFARVRPTQPIGLPYVTLQAKMLIKKGKVRHADLAGNSEKNNWLFGV